MLCENPKTIKKTIVTETTTRLSMPQSTTAPTVGGLFSDM